MVLVFVISYALPINNALAESSIESNGSIKIASSDTKGHWAEGQINKWLERKIVKGYADQSFHPNNEVTRAEFLAIINRVLGLKGGANASFSDVAKDAWYAEDVAKGSSAGIINGYSDQTFRPNQKMARQDAAVILARAFHLASKKDAAVIFKDEALIQSYAKSAVQALAEQAYLTGYQDQSFGSDRLITRAETVALVDRLVAEIYQNSGTFETATIKGNVVVNTDKVILKNTIIEGNLYLAAGIAQGDSTLDHVTVKGKTVITGGGSHSIHVDDSALGEVVVDKQDNDIRVEAVGSTTIENIFLQSSVRLEGNTTGSGGIQKVTIPQNGSPTSATLSGNFKNVEVGSSNASLNLEDGTVGTITVNAPSKLNVGQNTVVNKMTVNESAGGSKIQVRGTIKEADIKAANTEINGKKAEIGSGFVVNGDAGIKQKPTETSTAVTTTTNNGSTPNSPSIWTLAWSDEFNGSTIDTSKWGFDIGRGPDNNGWGNNEIEYYTNDERNVKLENGSLVITAVKDEINTVAGALYTSSRLVTKGKHAQKYGKIEVRAKTPEGTGLWPAIWMLPEDNKYGTWAASGEIDIMENMGRLPNTVSGTLHYGEQYPKNTHSGKSYIFPNNGKVTDYHVYSVEWEPGEFRWYVDGNLYQTQNDWYSKNSNQGANYAYPAPFDQAFHLVLNLALGGDFDGNLLPADSLFPAKMEVDYVRMYDLTGRAYRQPTIPVLNKENLPAEAKTALPDGNLVYNHNYDQDDGTISNLINPNTSTVANTDYWSLFTGAGGNGSVSVDTIGNRNYAKMEISNAGSQSYSVQLLNTVSIGKGHYYKLSFDAKSTANRSIIARVTGGATRGFVAYSLPINASLNDQLQHYELSFQMKQDTDILARTEFNVGLDNHTVWIGNVRVEEIDGIATEYDAEKTPLNGSGNRIYNGTFDQGDQTRMNYWHVTTANGAVAVPSVSEADRYLNLAITNKGSGAKGDIKLLQKGVYLINNQTYELTFNASSNTETTVDVELLSKDGLTSYAKETIALDNSTSLRTVVLGTMSAATDHEAQLIFHLGGAATTIQMDNILLKQTSLFIDPSIKLFPLVNGGFTGTLLPWERINVDGTATATLVDDGVKIAVAPYTGTLTYGMMLIQSGLSMKNALTYTVEFDARSSVDRKIEFILENAGYTRFFDQTVSLTNKMTHFSYEFTMSSNDPLTAKFLLGKVGDTAINVNHDIYIDNVNVEVKGAKQYANILTNGTVDNNADGWGSFFDGTGSLAQDHGELKAALTGTGGANWASQIDQVGFTLTGGKSYMLSFDARSSVDRTIEVAVEHKGGDYTKYLDKYVDLSKDGMHSYNLTFTMPATDAGAHVNFLLGLIKGDVIGAHDVFLDNISLVEVSMPVITPAEGHALLNGTFDTDLSHWQTYSDAGGTAAVIDGQMEYTVYSPGAEVYSNQLKQSGLKLEQGSSYTVTFDVYGTAARAIKVDFENTEYYHYVDLYNNGHSTSPQIDVSTDKETVTFDFTMTSATDTNAVLVFLFGKIGNVPSTTHKVYLDNIKIVKQP